MMPTDMESILRTLPPEMEKIIRFVLWYSEPGNATLDSVVDLESAANRISQAFKLSSTFLSPFFLFCLGFCIVLSILCFVFREYRYSKSNVLDISKYSEIGYRIARYCHNYNDIKVGKMRDDIDDIYDSCVHKYGKRVLRERKDEILSKKHETNLSNYIKSAIFIILSIFFLLIGCGGLYIGYTFRACTLLVTLAYSMKKISPFIFSYQVNSYAYLQEKSFRKMAEAYELEKIKVMTNS